MKSIESTTASHKVSQSGHVELEKIPQGSSAASVARPTWRRPMVVRIPIQRTMLGGLSGADGTLATTTIP